MNVTIEVYDTISKKIVEIEVDETFAREYKRMIWRNEKQDQSFYNHNVQITMLNGCNDNEYENYHEFICCNNNEDVTAMATSNLYLKRLKEALASLSDIEKKVIDLIYFHNLSEREASTRLSLFQQNIHRIKLRALLKMHKLLKKG